MSGGANNTPVCTCAATALILPVVTGNELVTLISYMTLKVLPFDTAFVYFGDFSPRMRSFDHITTSGLNLTSYLTSAHPFLSPGCKYCVTCCSYVFGCVIVSLVGHAGDLWPNGERYGVGLNRGHVGKCLWAFDWHHHIWTWLTLRGQMSNSLIRNIFKTATETRWDRFI